MSSAEISKVLEMLRELGHHDKASDLLSIYMGAHRDRPREFFEPTSSVLHRIDHAVAAAFAARLAGLPLEQDPGDLLVRIGQKNGWNPEDTAFLASISVEEYYRLLKEPHGSELHLIIATALMFGRFSDADEQYRAISIV